MSEVKADATKEPRRGKGREIREGPARRGGWNDSPSRPRPDVRPKPQGPKKEKK